jgi:hypothetical protein
VTIRILATALVCSAILFAGLLAGFQRRLIYFPQGYPIDTARLLPPARSVELVHEAPAGRQVSYYIAPAADSRALPARLWVLFCGNASLALDWIDLVLSVPDRNAGFLLVEYPGYGKSAGSPTRDSICTASRGAFAALGGHLGVKPDDLQKDLRVLGMSLGCAAGLELAVEHPVTRVVLLAPFSSLKAMGRRVAGWPLCNLVADRFDNIARLDELNARNPKPDVRLFHGDVDDIVPVTMSREMAKRFPDMVTYSEVPGADHNTLLLAAEGAVLKAMQE